MKAIAYLLAILFLFVGVNALAFFGTTSSCGGCVNPTIIPVNTTVPSVTGTVEVGHILVVNQGTWTNSPTSYTYQWQSAGTNVGGATEITYTPVSGDIGNLITVQETASNSAGAGAAGASATVGPVIP
jgi:hypothetical protein